MRPPYGCRRTVTGGRSRGRALGRGTTACRGASPARRVGGRRGWNLPADGTRGGRRLARVCAHRRRSGADLLGVRGAGGLVAARRRRREGRVDGRCVVPPWATRTHEGSPRCRSRRCADGRARRRLAASGSRLPDGGRPRRLVARDRRRRARDSCPDTGRKRGAVSHRVHVRDDRSPEGRAPRPGWLPLHRARDRVPGRSEAGIACSSRRTWAGSWARGPSSGNGLRRHDRAHGGRARPPARPPLEDRREERITMLGISPTLVRASSLTASRSRTSRRCAPSSPPASPGTAGRTTGSTSTSAERVGSRS